MKTQLSDRILALKQEAKKMGMTYEDLSAKSGIPVATLKNIFSGKTKSPRIDTILNIEKALGLKTIEEVLGEGSYLKIPMENMIPMEDLELFQIPLLGEVVAGVPIESQQTLEGYIYISRRPAEDYFALRVHGDSMKNVGIVDKSIIVCHKQETAESGEIVVAMLNGEQTVKRLKVHGDNIYLMPENPDFLPIPVTPTDNLVILGKVVELRVDL